MNGIGKNHQQQRKQVLALYRRIIRLGKTWTAQEADHTETERHYIREEARKQFRANRTETDPAKVRTLLEAGQNRVAIACHYGIPYERPPYLPPATSYDVDLASRTFKQRMPKKGTWTGVEGGRDGGDEAGQQQQQREARSSANNNKNNNSGGGGGSTHH